MKLYRHYKNKPYKIIGHARHSETLEEMTIYETRYDNEKGKIWVRPKDMFNETVEVNGEKTPRFREIPLQIEETMEVGETQVTRIAPLIEKAFGEWDPEWFHAKFNNHKKFHLLIGSIESEAVAFKLGYENSPSEFYSWLGGVIPAYRGLGIASDLMVRQHQWCREQGYKRVQTKTQNRFREMLLLNVRHGFQVTGTHQSDEGGLKIVLEKILV